MDMHELCYCDLQRRTDAIKRVLERAGGGKADIPLYSQSLTQALAAYMTTEREQTLEQRQAPQIDEAQMFSVAKNIKAYIPLKEDFNKNQLDRSQPQLSYEEENLMKGYREAIKTALKQQPEEARPQMLKEAADLLSLSGKQYSLLTEEFGTHEPAHTDKTQAMSFAD